MGKRIETAVFFPRAGIQGAERAGPVVIYVASTATLSR
jgi:hypothetical protein